MKLTLGISRHCDKPLFYFFPDTGTSTDSTGKVHKQLTKKCNYLSCTLYLYCMHSAVHYLCPHVRIFSLSYSYNYSQPQLHKSFNAKQCHTLHCTLLTVTNSHTATHSELGTVTFTVSPIYSYIYKEPFSNKSLKKRTAQPYFH